MAQLGALMWLKWTLFRNAMRSRKYATGSVASMLGTLLGLLVALLVALGLGAVTYGVTSPERGGAESAKMLQEGFVFIFFIQAMIFIYWAMMPLALGGGNRFGPTRMLLYPVSLAKLFILDLLSDLTSLSSIFAVPALVAIAIGAGAANGRIGAALVVCLFAVVTGLAFAKLLATAIGAMMHTRRTRGESLLALVGGVMGLAGALMGQLLPYMERHGEQLRAVWWTPPGAVTLALTYGLHSGPGGALYWQPLAALVAYALVFLLLAYRVARRTALGLGGRGRARASRRAAVAQAAPAHEKAAGAGWQLPFMSIELSAIIEKELRYAARNAQLRVVAIMAVGLTTMLRLMPTINGRVRGDWGRFGPYMEGAAAIFSMLYIFMLLSPLSTNLFGYEGAGMRSLVLAPVSRRLLLVGKNIATTLISLALAVVGVAVGGIVFRDLTWQALLTVALCFVIFAACFALCGNWLSLAYPKRMEFGKRMNRSGVAGLLMIPLFLLMLLPPLLASGVAYLAGSLAVKYVILAAFAVISAGAYLLLIKAQGRALERREVEIMEAVTGRSGEASGQVLG